MATTDKKIIELIINGQSANAAIKDLETTARSLHAQLRRTENPADRKALVDQYKLVQKEVVNWRNEIKNVDGQWSTFMKNAKTILPGVLGGQLLATGIQKLIAYFPTLIEKNAELSDAQANVQKTTGLTAKATEHLTDSLKALDTRTASKELLGLATVAGKLGISAEKDVLAFVRATDQLVVGLGEDLGGSAEDAINAVGKLVDIFKVKENYGIEDSILKVGSAINSLGAAGTANEGYLVEFAKRFGGIAPNANISIQDVLGLAAAADELGQTSEVSTTAIGQLIVGMGKDVPFFAKVANKSVKEFSDVLSKDANEALLMVLDGAKSVSGGAVGMADTLSKLGIDGARAAGIIGVLSSNLKLVRDRQSLANDEFELGTSLTKEFEVKNTNLAASWEKLQKRLENFVSNSTLKNFLGSIIGALADTRTESEKLRDEFSKQKDQFDRVQKNVPGLLARYDDLKTKSKLTKDEQIELKSVMNKIAEFVPTAISKWDAYGNAMDVNRSKVDEFVKTQEILLGRRNADAIASTASEIVGLNRKINDLQYTLNNGQKLMNEFGKNPYYRAFNNEEIKSMTEELKVLQQQLRAASVDYLDLQGKTIPVKQKIDPKIGTSTNNTTTIIETEEQKKAREKRKKEILADYKSLKDEILKLEQEAQIKQLPINEQELARVNQKYEQLLARAKGHKEEINQLNELWFQEVDLIRMKSEKDEANKFIEEGYTEQKTLLEQQRSDGLISEDEYNVKLEEVELAHLLNIKTMKEAFGEETLDIDKKIGDQQIKLSQAVTNNLKNQTKKQIDLLKEKENAEIELANTQYDMVQFSASTLRKYLGESELAFIAFLALEKTAAVSQIVLNMNKEIASYFAWAAGIAGPGGPALAAPYVTAAKVRAGISIGSVLVQTIDEVNDYSYGTKMFKKGGIAQGPKHSSGGIELIDNNTGKSVGQMEGGEPYMILSDVTYDQNKPLVDALLYSSMYEGGRSVMPDFRSIESGIKMFESGGALSASSINKSKILKGKNSDSPSIEASINQLNQLLSLLYEDGVMAKISYDEFRNDVKDARKAKRISSGTKSDGVGLPNGSVFLNDDLLG